MNGNNSVSMRRYIICLFLPIVFFSLSGCAHIEEEHFEEQEFVTLTFKATMEDSQTKNTLGGELGDPFRSLYWLPTDEIAVYHYHSNYGKFINLNKESSNVADFTGDGVERDTYYAAYPYSLVHSWGNWNELRITVPQTQTYAKNTFATDMFPMVAKAAKGETLRFKNLCGLLVVNLKGDENIQSVSLAAYDEAGMLARIAGTYHVEMTYESEPELTAFWEEEGNQANMITMECGEGVQLNPETPISFYFVLAPGEYSRIAVIVTTVDGKTMVKEGRNPLSIKRSEWVSAGALKYVESVSVDLSEIGHSNCYIVPKSGLYSFDADVIGNGDFGLVENANFHTTNTSIEPESADIVWEDRPGVISGLAFDGKKVSFMSTGIEGNALVAVKDANGTILWSWHIWVTDQPQEQVYVNDRGTFTMLDRNIGATRNDRGTGEEYRESMGMRYQWGRKDPFGRTTDSRVDLYNRISSQLSIAETILYPNSFVREYNPWTNEWDANLWSSNQKTIYDPCPVGYRVPSRDVWRGFTLDGEDADRRSEINADGSFDRGWNFIYDGGNTTWYPTSYYLGMWGDYNESETEGAYWSTDSNGDYWSYYFRFNYDIYSENPDFNCGVNFNQIHDLSNALAIRCMKDEGHVDISYPTVRLTSIKDITSTGATVVSNVTDEGVSVVTERGIVWGTSEEITLENAERIVAGTAGMGEYAITIDGATHSTRYYVRAYAISDRGTSYSDVKSFYTPYEGNAVNLSKDGTANCYIVPPVYSEYVFNASVKGNSDESVGTIASVEVLWETFNTTSAIEVGDVIESVFLEGNNIHFTLPFDSKPGNALIAVKDDLGTILWSWHIWVVDFDPVTTQQKYTSGAVMMDRNLGALSVSSGDYHMGEYSAFGLYYQWGRKDPMTLSNVNMAPSNGITIHDNIFNGEYAFDAICNHIDYTYSHPTDFYDDVNWDNNNQLWNFGKTVNDPCPVGWRVPDIEVWDGWYNNDFSVDGYCLCIPETYSTPAAYYPLGGYGDFAYSDPNNFAYHGYYWTTSGNQQFRVNQSTCSTGGWIDFSNKASVRCMKDAGTGKPGNGDDYIVDDEYEW